MCKFVSQGWHTICKMKLSVSDYKVRKLYTIFIFLLVVLMSACDFRLKPFEEDDDDAIEVKIQRYDRIESLYLTTGDFSALQQMNTEYPIETRTLIEKVLRIGHVDDPEINATLITFFQDSVLQVLVSDAELEFANVDDLNARLTDAFKTIREWVPDIKIPMIYTQISALDQSIVVGDESVGISIDKYLGEKYPLYQRFYDSQQRKTMTRKDIIPDLLSFYLLSRYRLPEEIINDQRSRDLHLAKIQWVVNKILEENYFKSQFINTIDHYYTTNVGIPVADILADTDYSKFDTSK